MEIDATTETTNEVFELNLCDMGSTIPVSHLSLEDGIDVPVFGWQQVFEQLGIKVLNDPAGRLAINTLAARKLFQHLRRRHELAVEARDRMFKKVAAEHPVPVMVGMPALEGMSPIESMNAAVKPVSPEVEFGGRPKPNFFAEELVRGQREMEEMKREAAAKAAQRLVDQAKDKLR